MENLFYERRKPETSYNLFNDDEPYHKKQLRKTQSEKIFTGICGGIGDYLEINPVWVRLFFIFGILLGGIGIILYLILFVFVPKSETVNEETSVFRLSYLNTKSLLGFTLLFIGLYVLTMPKEYFPLLFFVKIPMDIISPIFFVLLGGWVLKKFGWKSQRFMQSEFIRPKNGRLFMGVCVGLAEYLGVYSIIVRLLFIIFSFMTVGLGVLVYFIIVLLSKTDLRQEVV